MPHLPSHWAVLPSGAQLGACWVGRPPSGARLPVAWSSAPPPAPARGDMHPPSPQRGAGRRPLTCAPPLQASLRGQAGRHPPPTHQLELSDRCMPGPELGAGTWDQMWVLPSRGPHLGGGTEEMVTAMWPIDFCPHQPGPREGLGPRWATWVPGLGVVSGAALPGSWLGAAAPRRALPPAVHPRALLSACPRVAWSVLNLRPVVTSPEPSALIYVLLWWGVFSKNRMDVRKTTPSQNHA